MKRLITFLTGHYQDIEYYRKKKAEYTVNLLVLLILTMMLIMTAEILLVGYSIFKMAMIVGFMVMFFILSWLIKIGRLEQAINLLIVAGFLRELMIYFYETPYQFYATTFLIILTASVVHIRIYQLYASYIVTGILLIYKAYQYYHLYKVDPTLLRSYTQTIYTIIIYLVFVRMIHFLVDIMNREIRESEQLRNIAITDLLTGLFNRRCFDEVFKEAVMGCSEMTILMIDIDYFKAINDCSGHNHGDHVLMEFANLLKKEILDGTLFRWGGEEFLVLLPNYCVEESRLIAERLRSTIMNTDFSGEQLTISAGIAQYIQGQSLESFINEADKALYKSKENGRNQVSVS